MKNTDQRVSVSPRIIACIPAYNEENSIGPVIIRTMKYVDKVIVCDDGSSDLTGKIATLVGATTITHERNLGYGAAIRTLFKESLRLDAEIIITLDGDGQHDPNDIPVIVNKMKSSGSDIVIGSRFIEGTLSETPSWREKGIRLITRMVSHGGVPVSDAQSGIRAYGRRALESLVLTENGMGVSTEILLKASEVGMKIVEVPVIVTYNDINISQDSIFQGLDVILTTLKYMSINKPLKFYGFPGLLSVIISSLFWVWTIQIFTATRGINTNIALVALATTVVGLMLLTTAIILWVLVTIVREKA